MRALVAGLSLALTFAAGFAAGRGVLPALSQTPVPPAPSAQVVNLAAMTDEAIGPLINGTDLRSRTLVATEHGTVAVQSGNVLKHFHADADEIQYIVDGTGSFWLGDRQIEVKPGDLVVIPRGTAHAGSKAASGRFKSIAIKLPPQRPDDVHPVP